ncbi:hypothetical protein CES86_3053 [Brucella lupini]|uniref:Uncharacterized protein n=1 Tax=Brucella lupini TaxID=255457 RepID=A0A256GLM0_9HYPH|nr:hypothetical protein CES86_3053 [Brucella lupini]
MHDFCLWNNKSVLADGNALNSRGKAHFDRVLSSLHSLRVLVLNHLDVTCRQKTLCAY